MGEHGTTASLGFADTLTITVAYDRKKRKSFYSEIVQKHNL